MQEELKKITTVRIKAILNETKGFQGFNPEFILSINNRLENNLDLTMKQVSAVNRIYETWVEEK